jgi:hypothetical protein
LSGWHPDFLGFLYTGKMKIKAGFRPALIIIFSKRSLNWEGPASGKPLQPVPEISSLEKETGVQRVETFQSTVEIITGFRGNPIRKFDRSRAY